MMEIGLFQLENLAMTPSQFVFFDLRSERVPVHAEIDPLLARAESVAPARAAERLRELGVPSAIPIVLLCGDGRSAAEAGARLEAAGFDQIYVVEGGTRGLLAEL